MKLSNGELFDVFIISVIVSTTLVSFYLALGGNEISKAAALVFSSFVGTFGFAVYKLGKEK